MEAIIDIILKALENPTQSTLILVGWGLFAIERFHVGPAKEKRHEEERKQHKADLKAHGENYKDMTENATQAITKFMIVLEIIKDRMGQGGGS